MGFFCFINFLRFTPQSGLGLAAAGNNTEVMEVLIEHGADVNELSMNVGVGSWGIMSGNMVG